MFSIVWAGTEAHAFVEEGLLIVNASTFLNFSDKIFARELELIFKMLQKRRKLVYLGDMNILYKY